MPEGTMTTPSNACDLATAIRKIDFADRSVTLIGYGAMGHHYLAAFRALGVGHVRVCSRSQPLDIEDSRVEVYAGDIERFDGRARDDELAVIATPTALALDAARRLGALGFRRLLIEKPISLHADAIDDLARELDVAGVRARCAYNRVAYPSLLEVASRAAAEGGITSCTYAITEMVRSDWPERFPADELARWGVANSLHVVGMAHRLIGMPRKWSGFLSGALGWHRSGSVFVGSGVSESGIPFAYHADWGSRSRWGVEVHTGQSSYRLCPLEKVFRKAGAMEDWQEIPLDVFAPGVKAGVAEQVAAMIDDGVGARVSPPTLSEAADLVRYAEVLFGYAAAGDSALG